MPYIIDKNGREIMPGDTLKIFHFVGARRKKHYMYKFVESVCGKVLEINHLCFDGAKYKILLDGKKHEEIEIVQGYGSNGMSFLDRPKREPCK